MAGYTPYMMNPMNYSMMTPYQNQMMQGNMFGQQPQQMMAGAGLQGNMQQMQAPRQDFIGAFINNFDDVKSYPVPLGGTVMLMEKNSSKFYMKTIDNNGNPMINTYIFQDLSMSTDSKKEETNKSKDSTDNNEIETFKQNVTNAMREVDNRLKDLENKINKTEQRGAVK